MDTLVCTDVVSIVLIVLMFLPVVVLCLFFGPLPPHPPPICLFSFSPLSAQSAYTSHPTCIHPVFAGSVRSYAEPSDRRVTSAFADGTLPFQSASAALQQHTNQHQNPVTPASVHGETMQHVDSQRTRELYSETHPLPVSLLHSATASTLHLPAVPPKGNYSSVSVSLNPSDSKKPVSPTDPAVVRRSQRNVSMAGSKILLCEFCDASFLSLTGLKQHKDLVHLNKPAHVCTLCGKGFASKDHFMGHVNMHNNIKAHQCPLCSRKFSHKCSLRSHMKKHKPWWLIRLGVPWSHPVLLGIPNWNEKLYAE